MIVSRLIPVSSYLIPDCRYLIPVSSYLIPGTPNPVLSYTLDFPYLDIFGTLLCL